MTEREKIIETASSWGIDHKTAIKTRMRYLLRSIGEVKDEIRHWNEMIWNLEDQAAITLLNRRIERLDKKQRGFNIRIKNLEQDHQVSINSITSAEIEAARAFPIMDLLADRIKNKKVLCPFHDDHNPSASIKNNKLRCWVCSKSWNPIDYLMEKDGLSFIEAVRYLGRI